MARALRDASSGLHGAWKTLGSRGAAIGSIASLGSLYLVGLVVPQRARLEPGAFLAWRAARPALVSTLEAAGLLDVYASPAMHGALVLFFVCLAAALSQRVPRLLRRIRLDHGLPLESPAIARRKGTRSVEAHVPESLLPHAEALLSANGYSVHRAGSALRGVRFRWAPLGFLLFHGSFAVLLAGAILLDLTRFSGVANVAEGEAFDASAGPYSGRPRRPRIGRGFPRVAFQVLRIDTPMRDGSPIALTADVLVGGEAQPRTVAVNEPIRLGATSLLVMDVAPAPLLTCEGRGGASDGAWVKLSMNSGGVTRVAFPACGVEILARPAARSMPDRGAGTGVMAQPGGGIPAGLDAGLEVAVRDASQQVTRATLRRGESVATAAGSRVALADVRRFGVFQIVDESGGGLLWAGFVLAVIGLVLRLVLYRREIVVVADPAVGVLLLATAADGAVAGDQARVVEALVAGLSAPRAKVICSSV